MHVRDSAYAERMAECKERVGCTHREIRLAQYFNANG